MLVFPLPVRTHCFYNIGRRPKYILRNFNGDPELCISAMKTAAACPNKQGEECPSEADRKKVASEIAVEYTAADYAWS